MIEHFRRSGRADLHLVGGSRSAAEALAQIGDPAAVPVLLAYPNLNEVSGGSDFFCGVAGDTARAVRSFGEAAYPYCEERILGSRNAAEPEELYPLAIALEALGTHGSEEVEEARRQWVKRLKEKVSAPREPGGGGSLEPRVFRAALIGCAARHPQEVAEGIWDVLGNPPLCSETIRALSGLKEEEARPVLADLWKRFQEAGLCDDPAGQTLARVIWEKDPEIMASP